MCCTPLAPKQPQEPPQAPTPSPVRAAAQAATVALYNNHSGSRVCAGTRLQGNEILTAYHCVVAAVFDAATKEQLNALDHTSLSIDIVGVERTRFPFSTYAEQGKPAGELQYVRPCAIDRSHDLALLCIDEVMPRAQLNADIAALPPSRTDLVFAVGHPNYESFSVLEGVMLSRCSIDQGRGDACWYSVGIAIRPGSSGGGLYNERGELVGVASYYYPNLDVGGFAPLDAVSAILVGPRLR